MRPHLSCFNCDSRSLRDGLDWILICDSDLTQNAGADECVLKIECETSSVVLFLEFLLDGGTLYI